MTIDIEKEKVEIPVSPEEGFGAQEAKKGTSPAVKFGGLILGVFGVIGVSYYLNQDVLSESPSNLRGSGNLDGTLGGDVQRNSPRYQELLEQANEEAARRAEEEGRTFVRTVENVLEPVDILDANGRRSPEPQPPAPEPEPEPVPEPVEPRRVAPPPPPPPPPAPQPPRNQVPTTTSQPVEENPYLGSILGQMGSIATRPRTSSMSIVENPNAAVEEDEALVMLAENDTSIGEEDARVEALISAGQILYGETLTRTSSDMSGAPVLVKVTAGEFRGSRLIGSFAVNPQTESMVVNFTSMTLPDGTSTSINAFAVDGLTAESAVASDVNRRYLQRYGPILASAFISSFASARGAAEQTVTSVGDSTVVVNAARDAEQSLYAGLGAAAGVLAENIGASAPTGPEIILRDGYPIAIMFVETVQGQRE